MKEITKIIIKMTLENIVEQVLEDENAKALFNIKYFTHENELHRFVAKLNEFGNSQELIPYIDNMLDIPFFTDDIQGSYDTLKGVVERTAESVLVEEETQELLSILDKRYFEFTQSYNQKIKEADELGRKLVTKVSTEFDPRGNIEPYLTEIYKEISRTVKDFLGAKNLGISIRKDSPFLKREKIQQLGKINPDGDFFKFVFLDYDRTKIQSDERANADLDKVEEESLKKDWFFVHNIGEPISKPLQENNALFFYTGIDYPYIIERDREDIGGELGIMSSIQEHASGFLSANILRKLYHSVSDYYFGIRIPIRLNEGKRIGNIEVDALDIELPELVLSKFLRSMCERYAEYKAEAGPIIQEATVELLKKEENKKRKELIEEAYAIETSDDLNERLRTRGPAVLLRTERNQIFIDAGMENPFRNKLIKTDDGTIKYEIGEQETKVYDEFFFIENRPVRGHKIKAAQHLADLIAPALMIASRYYEVRQAALQDRVTTIKDKTSKFFETLAHRIGNQLYAFQGGIINRMIRQGNKLFPALEEVMPTINDVSGFVEDLSVRVGEGIFTEEESKVYSNRIGELKDKFEQIYKQIEKPSSLLKELHEITVLEIEKIKKTFNLFKPKEPAKRNIYETLDEHISQDHWLKTTGIKLEGKRSDIEVTTSYGLLDEVYNIVLENAREAILEKRKQVLDYNGTIEYGVNELDDEHVLMYIRDNGPGIPESVDVFDRAYTTKGPKHGTGLDFARYLVGEMNGSINVRNRQDAQGTIVELVLPKKPTYDIFDVKTVRIDRVLNN